MARLQPRDRVEVVGTGMNSGAILKAQLESIHGTEHPGDQVR